MVWYCHNTILELQASYSFIQFLCKLSQELNFFAQNEPFCLGCVMGQNYFTRRECDVRLQIYEYQILFLG